MKKLLLIPILFITLFSYTNNVFASTAEPASAYNSTFYSDYELLETVYSSTEYQQVISNLIAYYNSNYSSQYPYYIISVSSSGSYIEIKLSSSDVNKITASQYPGNDTYPQTDWYSSSGNPPTPYYAYNSQTGSYYSGNYTTGMPFNKLIYSSNSNIIFSKTGFSNYPLFESITFPSYSNLTYDVSIPLITIHDADVLPTFLSLKNGLPSASFTEVNLSNYNYIILSLKDYTSEPFNTTIYTLGSLCFTPVYNYGMKQKQDFYLGYQTAGCTEVYSSSTPVSIFIIESDITYHAVYYIKQEDNVPTTLKIPTSIFDITYITSQNSSDPQVIVGGRSYPVIPFNDLTDTANKSTEEGYISGQVCALGDVNCEYETGIGLDISDLFSNPIKVLQDVWSSITSFFALISTFILLIPSPMKEFLISAFMLSIVLGVIKIVLG